jgi:phosphoglycolate phosphatase
MKAVYSIKPAIMNRPALIFDLDGTLTDPREGITRCMRAALLRLDVVPPSDDDLARLIGPPLADCFRTLVGDEERSARGVLYFRECYGSGGLYENTLYPDIAGTLESLNALAPALFLATSKPRVYAERILDRLALRRYFRGVYGCELTGERADKAELLTHLLRGENLDRAAAVMIGDRMHDIAAARANGMRSVGVTWGFGTIEELRDARADTFCANAGDLVRWYQSV